MKKFFAKRLILQASLAFGVVLSTSHTVLCWPWAKASAPTLDLVKTTCDSAQNTVIPLTFRGLAKIVEVSNDHKMLGMTTVALAVVGASYLVSRPYVWANERAKRAEYRAAMAEREVELGRKTIEEYDLTLQNRTLASMLEKTQFVIDAWKSKAELAEYERDDFAKRMRSLTARNRPLSTGTIDFCNVSPLPDNQEKNGMVASQSNFYVARAPSVIQQNDFALKRKLSEESAQSVTQKNDSVLNRTLSDELVRMHDDSEEQPERTLSETSLIIHDDKDEEPEPSMENALKYARAQNILIEASKKA